MNDGKCFHCLGQKEKAALKLQLLCDINSRIAALAPLVGAGLTYQALTYAASMTLDFDGADYQILRPGGDVDFIASANRPPTVVAPVIGVAKTFSVVIDNTVIVADANLSFHISWTFVGAAPTLIAAGKVGVLSMTALGSAETDVICAWNVED